MDGGRRVSLCQPLCQHLPRVPALQSWAHPAPELLLSLTLPSLCQPPWSFPACFKAASIFQLPPADHGWDLPRSSEPHPGPTTEPFSFMNALGFAGFCCGRSFALASFPGALPAFPGIFGLIILVSLGFAVCNAMLLPIPGARQLHPFAGPVSGSAPGSLPPSCPVQPPPALHSRFPQGIPSTSKGKTLQPLVLAPACVSQPPSLPLPLRISGAAN